MTREFLKNLGLDDGIAGKILDENMQDIGKEKGNTTSAQAALADVQGKLETAQTELEELKKSSGDVAGLQQKIQELQTKYDTDTGALSAQIADRDYSDAMSRCISGGGVKFSSKAAEKAFLSDLREKKLELKDGVLTGFDEFLKQQKEADPSAFLPDKPTPRFVAPCGSGGAPAGNVPPSVAQAIAMGEAKAQAMKASADAMKNFS